MSNILDLVLKYTQVHNPELDDIYSSTTRINRTGDQLEFFVKDLICGTLNINDKNQKIDEHNKVFSWLGSRNHPPDIMIDSGEAIEVKKSRSSTSVQLNSSTPHHKIRPDDSRIIEDVRQCEDWSEKDMVYVVGNTDGDQIEKLWVTYGDCWGDNASRYNDLADLISQKIAEGVKELQYGNLDTEDTNEIGKVYEVDPAGRTRLRIRGMWTIDHPEKCFSQYIQDYDTIVENSNPLFFVIRKSRFDKFSTDKRREINKNPRINVHNVEIEDPSNEDSYINVVILESRTRE